MRALCHYTRVMLGDRPMSPLTQDWDSITQSSSITLKASRVAECFNFDYQVNFYFWCFLGGRILLKQIDMHIIGN